MGMFVFVAVTVAALFFAYVIYKAKLKAEREQRIAAFEFPPSIEAKILEKYPHLKARDVKQVMTGLREYFHVCNLAGNKMVSMPSQVVDVAWHEFILFTRQYDEFCKKAFGRFLHHTPAEAMTSPTVAQRGIKEAWKISCMRESIVPKSARKLPLLFALDTKLKIPDGFKYSLNCTSSRKGEYCATHIGCGASCGSGDDGDSSGCGGGCGGD